MRKFPWDKKYLHWGVTAFAVIAASILFFLVIANIGSLAGGLGKLVSILSPFVWGLVIAYLLCPLQKIYQRHLFLPLAGLIHRRRPDKREKLARGLSVFLCVLTLILLVTGLVSLVGPQLYSSVESIIANSSTYISNLDQWVTRLLKDYPQIEKAVSGAIGDMSNGIVSWASSFLLPRLSGLLGSITANVLSAAVGIYNVLIGIIVSVYVLYNREAFTAHCKKILYSVCSLDTAAKILEGLRFTNQTFMGFLSGKILDSLIIGILCYIGCLILGMPYALLVAVLVGIFNIIPFFGPILGAVPSAIIILTDSPLKMLIFIIFIIILQQFDGNILGPRILGDSVGVNGFWILFSIILASGILGFIGMVIGVPVFVVIYTFLSGLVRRGLERKRLPTEAADYMRMGYIDPETGQPTDWPAEEPAPAEGARKPRSSKRSRFNFRFIMMKKGPKKGEAEPPDRKRDGDGKA